MNREELKKHITNFRLNLPQGVKFSVIAQSSAVLESSKDLHCEYLYVAMDRHGYNWARMTYGEIETRIEGSWIGTSWLKVYPCYDEEHLVMVDGVPCQYVGETNPFQDDPMLERPVPSIEDYMRKPSQQGNVIRAMAAILKEGMTERDGLIDISSEAFQKALDIGADKPAVPVVVTGAEPMITRRQLDTPVPFTGMPLITAPLLLTGKNVDFADVCGDYLGLGDLAEEVIESRSAGKSLLRNPISLKDTPHGEFQAYRRTKLHSSEYRARKLVLIEEELKFTEDEVNNRRRLNNASLYLKVMHKRAVRGLDRAVSEESMTARCTQPLGGHIEPEDHTVDSILTARAGMREMKEEGGE